MKSTSYRKRAQAATLRLHDTLDAYWPHYLAHHTHRKNRAYHDAGDICVLMGLATMNPFGFAVGVFAGYTWAFVGHYRIEGRKPATLEHPVLAAISNWRMFALGVTGKLDAEMREFGLESEGTVSWGVEVWRSRWVALRQSTSDTHGLAR